MTKSTLAGRPCPDAQHHRVTSHARSAPLVACPTVLAEHDVFTGTTKNNVAGAALGMPVGLSRDPFLKIDFSLTGCTKQLCRELSIARIRTFWDQKLPYFMVLRENMPVKERVFLDPNKISAACPVEDWVQCAEDFVDGGTCEEKLRGGLISEYDLISTNLYVSKCTTMQTPVRMGSLVELIAGGVPGSFLEMILGVEMPLDAEDEEPTFRACLSAFFSSNVFGFKDVPFAERILSVYDWKKRRFAVDYAVFSGAVSQKTEILKNLLQSGGNPNALEPYFGYMPALSIAVNANSLPAAKLLLQFGADLFLKVDDIESPWERCEEFGSQQMKDLFRQYALYAGRKRAQQLAHGYAALISEKQGGLP